MKLKNVLIFGAHGGFGRLFSNRFSGEGATVTGVDLAERSGFLPEDQEYIQSDLSMLDPVVREQVEGCDGLFICLPERVAFDR